RCAASHDRPGYGRHYRSPSRSHLSGNSDNVLKCLHNSVVNEGTTMPVTKEQVETYLRADEPDYAMAKRLGLGALPHLEAFARDADPGIAAKAVYLASLIGGEAATSVIVSAAQQADPVVRVAAAAALGNVSADRLADVAVHMLADPEEGVRRQALAALPK